MDAMLENRAEMSYKCLDFDSDKPALYNALQFRMAELNPDEVVHVLEPISITPLPSGDMSPEELKDLKAIWKREDGLILKGKHRIMENLTIYVRACPKPYELDTFRRRKDCI